MADYGGFQVQTPQEVLARLQAQRDQFRQSNNPAVRRQAIVDQALDSLFGNPQIQAAENVTAALNKAGKKAMDASLAAGDDDLSSEMRRLKAMRDAIADVDPATASQINGQLLKLGTEKMERAKLLAETEYKRNEDLRQGAEAGRQEGEYQMKVAEFPLDIKAKQAEIATKLSETVNYANPKTGEVINVGSLDSLAIKQLQKAGWVKVGLNVQTDEPGKLGQPTKPVQTDLQTNIIQSQQQLDMLGQVMQKYDPDWLKALPQIGMASLQVLEKAGVKLDTKQAATLEDYAAFRRNSYDAFNRYIKFITGAQMSVAEAERISKGFPNPDSDSNTVFMSKTRETVKALLAVNMRAQQALKDGLPCAQTGECDWDKVITPQVPDKLVDQFMSNYLLKPEQKPQILGRPNQQKQQSKSRLDSRIDQILGQ